MPTDLLNRFQTIQIASSPVYFLKIDDNAKMPAYAKAGDAGMDVFSIEDHEIYPHTNAVIRTGLRIKIPEGCVGLACSRSGLSAKFKVSVGNSPGVIDSGYTGEVKIILENNGRASYSVHKGDKIAQIVIVPFVRPALMLTDQETFDSFETDRGCDGFGSTGTK